jgi:hypothetical protein
VEKLKNSRLPKNLAAKMDKLSEYTEEIEFEKIEGLLEF